MGSTSTIIVNFGGAREGTHGNSVTTIGGGKNLIGNKRYEGPASANDQGWNQNSTSPLPFELTSFIVKMLEDRAHLEWTTASETNNDYFVVERKTEYGQWEPIGQIHGKGTSNELHFYQYEDYEVNPNEVAFYRLLQVDFDGKEHRHHIIKAEGIEIQGHSYKIMKSESIIEVLFEDDHNEPTEVMLIDSYGMVLSKESLESAVRGFKVSFDLSRYPTGWYVVGISGNDNFHFEKMVHVN